MQNLTSTMATKLTFGIFGIILFINNCFAQPFPIVANIPYNGSYASGTYQIYRSSFVDDISLSQLRKTVIFIEGYDPNNNFRIQDLYQGLESTGITFDLHNLGYDIVILNFNQGGDYIQKNSFLLVELIKQINDNSPNQEPLVVIGYSMGGLVARYALTYMEEHEPQTGYHNTRLFISYDSPHKGAHVPANIQALALTFSNPSYLELIPDLALALNLFTSPAAKQMLKYNPLYG